MRETRNGDAISPSNYTLNIAEDDNNIKGGICYYMLYYLLVLYVLLFSY